MKKPKLDITCDEIWKQIKALSNEAPQGFTISEMSIEIGHTPEWCRIQLRSLMRAGKAECVGKREERMIDGRRCNIPVYRITGK